MGCSIKFVRRDDFISDIDVVDLSTDGYSLANDGYFQTVAPIGAKSVRESITLKLQGTSKDDLAAMTQELNDKILQVQWWIDNPGVERYQVWLRVQLDNETYSRQAQILNIQPPDRVKTFTINEMRDNYIGEYQIGIERTPFWEGDPINEVTKTGLSTLGGTVAMSAGVNGDVPARLQRVKVTVGGELIVVSTAWIGFKSSRFGTAANFVSRWGLNTGIYGDDTSATADATSSTGFRIVTTFATEPDLEWRVNARMAVSAPANPNDQRGTYQVLLRAKMNDNASTALVRIGYGFNLNHLAYRSRVTVSGSLWHLYEMGTVKIPPYRTYNYNDISNFIIGVYAQRASGTGSLYMDCVILIPIDDGAISATTAPNSLTGVGDEDRLIIYQAADGSVYGAFDNADESYDTAVTKPQGSWSAPNDTTAPVIVVAAEDYSLGSILGDTINLKYIYIPRFRTLRGNVA